MALYKGDPMDWPRMGWAEFTAKYGRSWRQGEHVILVGENGSGKTTLAQKILPMRRFVCVFVTKTYDPSFDRKYWPGFKIHTEWHATKAARDERILLWPKPGKTIKDTVENQRRVFGAAINEIYRERNWSIFVDEMQWVVDQLGFGMEMKTYQHQARSSGITIVSGFQRPSGIPPVTYGAAKHAFIARQAEDTDQRRLAELAGLDASKLRAALPLLPMHHFLYISRAATTGAVLIRAEL